MVDFELVGSLLAVDDAGVGGTMGEPVVEGDGAGGGDEDEIAGGEDSIERFVVEEAEAEFSVAVFAEEVGDAAEVVCDELFFGIGGEK